MGRVFITQQPRPNRVNWMPNLSPASGYGQFVFVFGSDDVPWTDPDGAFDKANAVLKDFNPDEDYILWPNSGDPAACWVCLLLLARFPIDKLRMLYWERKLENGERHKGEGFYTPITFRLPV